ncbi:hypothetical protein BDV35DRAFT_384831 [Aspergillus flavus]|uniref:Uncharacterized protein n=1 Tax=Aspergillus flavus TaxID=5059 RepID=A0A5N6GKG0_ASPFL|nr:hypothetical protein BDV35DRAFT_384831 [Aspergillus flavus]
MSSSPIMMIGAYVSYEVIASSATFNSAVKEENGKIYFMIYSGFHDQFKAVCIEGITLKNKELKLRFSGNRPQKKHAADGNTKIRKIKI